MLTVTKTAETVELSGEFAIQPRSEQLYAFEVKLPLNCRISTRSTGWYLQVELEIPGAVDPKGKATLDVQPAEEFLAVVETCEAQLRFSELPKKRRWRSKTLKYCPRGLWKPIPTWYGSNNCLHKGDTFDRIFILVRPMKAQARTPVVDHQCHVGGYAQ